MITVTYKNVTQLAHNCVMSYAIRFGLDISIAIWAFPFPI